jgi:RNA polymerase sigma-70 factor (ECF subfamily)
VHSSSAPQPGIDRALVDQLQTCAPGAAAELVMRHQKALFGLAYRMLGNRQDAEDVVQESFVRAIRAIHRFDGSRSLRPWLLGIVANRCRTALERRRRRPQVTGVPDLVADHRSHATPDAAELAEALETGMTRLRPEYRLVFALFHEQGLAYEDIAREVCRPVGTVKTWIHRARIELASYLQRMGHEVPAGAPSRVGGTP